jgi:hypothetical protein
MMATYLAANVTPKLREMADIVNVLKDWEASQAGQVDFSSPS